MKRGLFLITTTAFWLAMMSQLIYREFFRLTPIETLYEVLPLHNIYLREEYRGIYLSDQLVGFNFTVLDTADEDPKGDADPGIILRHQTYLSFLFLGQEREMLVKGKARLDSQLNLEKFEVHVSSGQYWTQITGQLAGGNMNLVVEGKEGEPVRKIVPVAKPLFFSEALPFIWTPENLKSGKRGRIQVWNPLLMSFEDIRFRVGHKVILSYQGQKVETFVIYLDQGGIETRSWVTPEGIVLRQESPMGLILEKEEGWQIFDKLRKARTRLLDLPNLYSIPANRQLKDPASLQELTLRITTPQGEKTLTLRKEKFDDLWDVPLPLEKVPQDVQKYLKPTPWIQSDDPLMKAKAREMTGDESSALAAALRLMEGVHRDMTPLPTVSLPSAREVLAVKKGDCNEYTALFTALARAVGIPTRMVAGVVYRHGRFFYHAWPEVYLGRWIGLDPTFHEAPVDVTHVPLVIGDLKEQIELVKKLGQIQLVILDAK